jgi:hypothetical protein
MLKLKLLYGDSHRQQLTKLTPAKNSLLVLF